MFDFRKRKNLAYIILPVWNICKYRYQAEILLKIDYQKRTAGVIILEGS